MGLESKLGDNVLTTQLDKFLGWARKNSLWPMPFGTACCAIEFMSVMCNKYDLARFGAEAMPEQLGLLMAGVQEEAGS